MPFGNGTGPTGQGPRTGGGFGRRPGGGRGRQPGGFGFGPSGECVCPKCGAKSPHRTGIPCYEARCPKCGSPM